MYHASYIISSFLAACPTFWCFLRCDSDDLPGLRIPQGFPEGGPYLPCCEPSGTHWILQKHSMSKARKFSHGQVMSSWLYWILLKLSALRSCDCLKIMVRLQEALVVETVVIRQC